MYNTTVEERVGLQKTASAYVLLNDEDKNNFLEEVRKILTTKLRNRDYFTLEEEIQICYAYNTKGI